MKQATDQTFQAFFYHTLYGTCDRKAPIYYCGRHLFTRETEIGFIRTCPGGTLSVLFVPLKSSSAIVSRRISALVKASPIRVIKVPLYPGDNYIDREALFPNDMESRFVYLLGQYNIGDFSRKECRSQYIDIFENWRHFARATGMGERAPITERFIELYHAAKNYSR